MSTKNLARTVIEGGRTGFSKYLRRQSLRVWRTNTNRICRDLVSNRVDVDEVLWDERPTDWDDISHDDRTNPCDRFLASRAGRRWDDVRSEIMKKFDTRSLAGRHVTYSHMIDRVRDMTDPWFFYRQYGVDHRPPGKFWVDDQGILRHDPSQKY